MNFNNNVRSVKKDTKHSSVLLLRLVSFFTEQTLFVCDLFFAVKNIYRGCWLTNNGFGTLLENNLTYYGGSYSAKWDSYSLKDVQESCKKLAQNAGKGFFGIKVRILFCF